MKNYPGPFWSPQMFKYKEKRHLQSVVHCRKAIQNSDELIFHLNH